MYQQPSYMQPQPSTVIIQAQPPVILVGGCPACRVRLLAYFTIKFIQMLYQITCMGWCCYSINAFKVFLYLQTYNITYTFECKTFHWMRIKCCHIANTMFTCPATAWPEGSMFLWTSQQLNISQDSFSHKAIGKSFFAGFLFITTDELSRCFCWFKY